MSSLRLLALCAFPPALVFAAAMPRKESRMPLGLVVNISADAMFGCVPFPVALKNRK